MSARGSALVETLVLMGVLAPMLFGIALVGKYLDVKGASLEAARYSVWERTVWTDRADSGRGSEARKTDYEVGEEVHTLVLGHPGTMVESGSVREHNPLWVNRRHERILSGTTVLDERGQPQVVAGSTAMRYSSSPVTAPLVDRFANGPVRGAGLTSAADAVGNHLGSLASGCGPGIDFERGLGLGSDNFITATVAIPGRDFLGPAGSELMFTASAAILSNSWTAADPKTYRQRVDGLVVDELVGCAVLPGRMFAVISLGTNEPLYGEGLRSYPVVEALDHDVLPRGRRP